MMIIAYLLAIFPPSILSLASHEITFLIMGQSNKYHQAYSNQLRDNIIMQSQLYDQPPDIHISYETFEIVGSWSMKPILAHEEFAKIIEKPNKKWIIICEDQSMVNLEILLINLNRENYLKKMFLGYSLRDVEATIIHHFAFFENPSWFQYPLFRAGVAFTIPLLKELVSRIRMEKFSTDFFIDSSHELSLFAWNNGNGQKLTETSYFCLEKKTGCAIYGVKYPDCTHKTATIDNILFAVKTYHKFHNERLPIIKQTWAKEVKHIRYYSDIADGTYQTIDSNVLNAETGHCAKVLSIFNLILSEIQTNVSLQNNIKWIVLTDDDTLLSSIEELINFLGCLNSTSDIYLGERYGYRLQSIDGFNYITGGGGTVFSYKVIEKLHQTCNCPTDTSPDDMIIGLCAHRIDIEPIHSEKFHQARPTDYPPEYIHDHRPISFHKFWQIDPIEVYEKWLNGYNRYKRLKGSVDLLQNSNEIRNPQICKENSDQRIRENLKLSKHDDL